jgi:prephenate dehydrogenase
MGFGFWDLTDNPPFSTVAIAGLGLIGGSIALGLRDRWPSCRIVGVDRAAVQAHALSSGAIDRTASSLAETGPVDLVVLAAPVGQNVELLGEAARHAGEATVITDVGGTKRDIVNAARALPQPAAFIGGHPIGGGERGGFGFARPNLFEGRPWIFTPEPTSRPDTLERLFQLARALGARPSTLEADEHDRLMAFISHLPQLMASTLMQVAGTGAAADGLRFAGRGLVDTTRLASSPPNVWRDLCAANADAIGAALDLLIERLTRLRADLSSGATVDALFEEAARWRAELMKGQV